jgi:hypothetical protein
MSAGEVVELGLLSEDPEDVVAEGCEAVDALTGNAVVEGVHPSEV